MMRRKFKTKIPEVKMTDTGQGDPTSLEVMKDRDALKKLKSKEYTDTRRSAKESDFGVGDQVLVKELHKSDKLTPPFDPTPHEVIEKKGNAVLVQSPGGPLRMRNAAHMKRFNPAEPSVSVQMPSTDIPVDTACNAAPPSPKPPDRFTPPSPRPTRERRAPNWKTDFVPK